MKPSRREPPLPGAHPKASASRLLAIVALLAWAAGEAEAALGKRSGAGRSRMEYILANWNGRKPAAYSSQFGEDFVLEQVFFKRKFNGFFVELGGFDGVSLSNTLFLERYRRWTGVLIEAHPDNFKKMVKNRPRAKCIGRAICAQQGFVSISREGSSTSGILEHMSDTFKAKFGQSSSQSIKVPCSPIGRLLREANVTHIDLFSVDVEGAEDIVLSSMDWSIPTHVVALEMDGTDGAKEQLKRRIMKENNFTEYTGVRLKNTGIFVNASFKSPSS